LAVFIPSFFMEGAAKALFAPLALARRVCDGGCLPACQHVCSLWCLLGSFVRTHRKRAQAQDSPYLPSSVSVIAIQSTVRRTLHLRWSAPIAYLLAAALIIVFVGGRLGTEIFPRSDSGQLQLRNTRTDGYEDREHGNHGAADSRRHQRRGGLG